MRLPAAPNTSGERKQANQTHTFGSPPAVSSKFPPNMAAALAELDPSNATIYEQNLAQWLQEIDQVDADIRLALSGHLAQCFSQRSPLLGVFCGRIWLADVSPRSRKVRSLVQKTFAKIIERARTHRLPMYLRKKA